MNSCCNLASRNIIVVDVGEEEEEGEDDDDDDEANELINSINPDSSNEVNSLLISRSLLLNFSRKLNPTTDSSLVVVVVILNPLRKSCLNSSLSSNSILFNASITAFSRLSSLLNRKLLNNIGNLVKI